MSVVWLLRCAGWWILDYAYAGWWQLRSLFSRAKASDYGSGHRCAVVVLPGVYEHWRFMLPLIRAVHGAGHPVHVIDALRLNLMPVQQAADVVRDYLDDHGLEHAVILAHSKGGLIGKTLMSGEREPQAIEWMITICTPFSGSRYARTSALRAFSADDPALGALIADASAHARITSIFGVFDPHIPEGSRLAGARNVRLETGGHFRILGRRETVAIVLGELGEASRERRGTG
jgi:pimeloyl-ACP methyl ester carboxylesterase